MKKLANTPSKIIEEHSDMNADLLFKSIKNSLKASLLSSCLKNVVITLIYKGKKDFKRNYRPLSAF